MACSLIMFFMILNILILLSHSISHHQNINTRSLNQPQLSSYSTIPKLILFKEPNSLTTSITKFTTNSFNSRRLVITNLYSRHRQITRGLIPDVTNFASNTLSGFFGNSNSNLPNSQPNLPAQTSRQLTNSQDLQPLPSGDSRAMINGRQSHPTQLPSPPVSSSKSQSAPTNSTTSLKSQPTAISNHSPSSTTATRTDTSSSVAPSPTDQSAPRSLFERIRSYYKPTNRFALLAILITIGLVLGILVGLMAVLKCVAHRERFANKKDYPTGFPWVEPGNKSIRNSAQQDLDFTSSHMSTRNSMTSSVHFNRGLRLDAESEVTSHQVEYQLNELGSDVYGDYTWAAPEIVLEKNSSSSIDQGLSSASTEESKHNPSTQEHHQWHIQSLGDSSCFVRGGKGEILEDSKVFALGHP